ncbi:DinB superfamily protein [bacterium 336/3]|nr:DinB superfamily protein [bacterium 336/3]
MNIQTLQTLFRRDLEKLKSEIELYQNEATIWLIEPNISNSAGNLCLHLIGNLNHFIGTILGKTDYVRNRELEFSEKNVPRTKLTEQIEKTIEVVEQSLSKVSENQLQEEYPLVVLGKATSTHYFLFHLIAHLSYHLGQINYHRRLLDK